MERSQPQMSEWALRDVGQAERAHACSSASQMIDRYSAVIKLFQGVIFVSEKKKSGTAVLKYDKKTGRLLFTKQMKKDYTILMPMMLPFHFTLIEKLLQKNGYNMQLLTSTGTNIVDEGLQSVHNDTCYPALLVIGQLLDAIKSGEYDPERVAVAITQTGGGCRASNYIHLLRKALKKNHLENVPVVSVSIGGLERNPGFNLSKRTLIKLGVAIIYADLIMDLSNQARPYELSHGETDMLANRWIDKLANESLSVFSIKRNMIAIVQDFAKIPLKLTNKVKVGVVGEIYVKFAPLGNNNLEAFLAEENCEVVVPGLMDFVLYNCESAIADSEVLGINRMKAKIYALFKRILCHMQDNMIAAVKNNSTFRVPPRFDHIRSLVRGYLSTDNKMGEGWLLTGEMLELIESGVGNIVCTQPFGCLPNHIAGKGMIREIRRNNESANIVAIDYDPSATRINQENRIKLMLELAREQVASGDQPDENTPMPDKNVPLEKKAV